MEDNEVFERIAEYMQISADTAPKSMGMDSLVSKVITDSELREIGEEMIRMGKEHDDKAFVRDGNNVLDSSALLVVGTREHEALGLDDCGACGFETCEEFDAAKKVDNVFEGPNCVFKLLDLGIALGSAAKTASIHNVDSRIMYKIGAVARKMGMIDATVVMGIPISGKHKSPYFDR